MTISSRTPEGLPNLCRVCGNTVTIEPSLDSNDATCPHCGCLLWFIPEVENSPDEAFTIHSEMQSAAHSEPDALPSSYVIPLHARECMPESVARENVVIPLVEKGDRLVVAFPDPLEFEKYDKLSFILNRKISIVHADRRWIEQKILETYG